RDGGFKLWRQTTLTVIQRLWPGDLPKSERFRRIPFTALAAKPSRDQVRHSFERGCGEASAYLRALILEVQSAGLAPAASGAPAAGAPPPAFGRKWRENVDNDDEVLARRAETPVRDSRPGEDRAPFVDMLPVASSSVEAEPDTAREEGNAEEETEEEAEDLTA